MRPIVFLLMALALAACSNHVVVGREDKALSRFDASTGAVRDAGRGLDAGELACGASICGPVDLGIPGEGAACCFGASTCGAIFSNGCVELDIKGVEDPSCPSFQPLIGCCQTGGACGLIAPGLPFGCVALPGGGRCVYRDE